MSSRRRKSKSSASASLSQSSTASSARLRASAKKAALSVEAVALKTRQNIHSLKQKKENFELETELAKAKAEEKVYSYCEEQRPSTPSSQLLTSHETRKESTVDIPECQESQTLTLAGQFSTSTPAQVEEKETIEVPVHQTGENQEVKCSPLNLDAPVWKVTNAPPL